MSSDLVNAGDAENVRLDPRLSELVKVVLITQVGGQGPIRVTMTNMLPHDASEIREMVSQQGLG
jgi:hypothetical protein